MVVVVADAEPLLDQVTDHRPSPNTRLVASLYRTKFDDDRQRLALLLRELGGRAFGNPGPQALDMIRVVPLKPAVHGAAGHIKVGSDVDDPPAVDVGTNRPPSSPFRQIILQLRREDELVELFELHRATPSAPDCLTGLRSSHDHQTVILPRSFVKIPGSQPARSCLGLPQLDRHTVSTREFRIVGRIM